MKYKVTIKTWMMVSVLISSLFTCGTAFAEIQFQQKFLSNTIGGAQNIICFDLDKDGDLDIIASADKLAWWENKDSLHFDEHIISETCLGSITARPYDTDNDGDYDLVTSHYDRKMISIWVNDGTQDFTERVVLENYDGAHDAYAGDLDGDGIPEIAAARGDAQNNGEIVILTVTADSVSQKSIFRGDFCHSLDIADFNGDGKNDIVSSHFNQGVRLFINDGNGDFTSTLFNLNLAHYVRAFDFDGDGDKDFGCAALTGSFKWWENIDSSNFTKHSPINAYALFFHVDDIDLDGDNDLLISDAMSARFKWMENIGTENFSQHTLPATLQSISGVCSGDLDNDGDVDLVSSTWRNTKKIDIWENLTNPVSVEDEKTGLNDYHLYQNYPNPFNPATKIRFSVGQTGRSVPQGGQAAQSRNTSLIIYDSTGREVATLLNENMEPGIYEVSWNASGCSAGIYFCSLRSGEYKDVKKLIFLK